MRVYAGVSILTLLLAGCSSEPPPPPSTPPPPPVAIQKAQAVEQQVMDSKARLDEALDKQD